MDEPERVELIAAVVTLTTAVAEILALTERLLGAHEATITPSPSELADAREQVGLWREQLDLLKVRVASLTVEPPERPQ